MTSPSDRPSGQTDLPAAGPAASAPAPTVTGAAIPTAAPDILPRAGGDSSGGGASGSGGHDPYAALRFSSYRLYAVGTLAWNLGQQMIGVVVGWQVYQLTHSATALGLMGLIQALPLLALAIPAGHLADRMDRKRIVLCMLVVLGGCSLALAVLSDARLNIHANATLDAANSALRQTAYFFREKEVTFNQPLVPLLFLLLLLMAIASTFASPARAAILPQILPMSVFSNAVTWNSSAFQVSSMVGPALGGGMVGWLHAKPYAYSAVYALDAVFALIFLGCLAAIPYRHVPKEDEGMSLKTLSAGVRFVFEKKIILATITLDLFAVLLGGATALLPIYADQLLHVGPAGLGWLRAAPSVGAFVMALVLAHRPPLAHAGRAMLWAVAGFGAATIVFGFSHWLWLSLLMLALTGAFDNISVVVRHTLVQVLTPNDMRGRVSAVNAVFIGSSNELGGMESGLTAAAFGPVASVVAGGIGTILVVLAVAWAWPEVREFGSLGDVR